MGCGKSSVGRTLHSIADGFDFIDLDDYIEQESGKKVSALFSEYGENAFRDMEFQALKKIFGQYSRPGIKLILALGGGTLVNKASADIVSENSTTVYLRATLETLENNLREDEDKRPLLKGIDLKIRIMELMAQRSAIYENTAAIIVDTDNRTYSETAEDIIEALELR